MDNWSECDNEQTTVTYFGFLTSLKFHNTYRFDNGKFSF